MRDRRLYEKIQHPDVGREELEIEIELVGYVPPREGPSGPRSHGAIDARSWEWEQSQWLAPGATTSRLFTDDSYADQETSFLVWPRIEEARAAWRKGMEDRAWTILHRVETNFPRMCEKFPELLRLRAELAAARDEREVLGSCRASLKRLAVEGKRPAGFETVMRRWRWSYPLRRHLRKRLIYFWERKHRIPGKLARILMNLAGRRTAA